LDRVLGCQRHAAHHDHEQDEAVEEGLRHEPVEADADPGGSCLNSGPFLTSPLGANFDPMVEVVPQG
jgi:hypothetical protein